MIELTEAQIKEIAEQLDMGMLAYFHKQTGELLFTPNTDQFPDIEEDLWREDLDKLEVNSTDYKEINAMTSTDSFRVMEDFVEQLKDATWQKKLNDALDKKKPFSQFKYTLQYSKPIQEQWYAFRDKRYIEWVQEQLSFYKMEEQEKQDETKVEDEGAHGLVGEDTN